MTLKKVHTPYLPRVTSQPLRAEGGIVGNAQGETYLGKICRGDMYRGNRAGNVRVAVDFQHTADEMTLQHYAEPRARPVRLNGTAVEWRNGL